VAVGVGTFAVLNVFSSGILSGAERNKLLAYLADSGRRLAVMILGETKEISR